jgi:hypothetical protein
MDTQSPNDILRVANIDINCSLNDPEVHPESQNKFTVVYAKNPYTIDSGKTRLFPRFIAEHYAKHLTDHILTSQNKPISDNKERPLLLKQILLGVEESFSASPEQTEGEKIAEEVAKLEADKVEATEPVNPTGYVEPAVVPVAQEPQELTIEEAPKEEKKPMEQRPTLRELKEEADKLGIKYKRNVTVDQLLSLIRAF